MIEITRALIIREPWIGKILSGEKDWEMRGRRTSVRGRVGLIQQGTGRVVGIADIVDTHGPLSHDELVSTFDHHRIPAEHLTAIEARGWTIAWKLGNVCRLLKPVEYEHPGGAVIWVKLSPSVSRALSASIKDATLAAPVAGKLDRGASVLIVDNKSIASSNDRAKPATIEAPTRGASAVDSSRHNTSYVVPVAKDGSYFGPHLARAGAFTIGPKGDERKVTGYESALSELQKMPTARWRRPNPRGNWGIVSAVAWRPLSELERPQE